jgi:peptide/nickel transport system substrate-binding protein
MIMALLVILSLLGCSQIAPQASGKPGGTLVIGLYQEPATLNIALSTQTVTTEVDEFLSDALIGITPQGEYYAQLAKEVPSVQNGGISADGLTVTYHLREGIKWGDGKPCTCDDWKFTWEVQKNPESGVRSTTGWKDIQSVDCPNANTIIFKFSTYFAPHLQIVGGSYPFPRHATGDPAKMQEWAYNRAPLGNGPYKFVEWASGDHITLARSEHYTRGPGNRSALLDRIIFKIIPSRDVGKQLLKTGEIDVLWGASEADIPDLAATAGTVLITTPDARSERLILNLRNPEIDAPSADRLRKEGLWHWALGDVRVRQAINYGIDKKLLVDKLLYGKTTPGSADINTGWAKPNLPANVYDPQKAKQLLSEAGWKDTDGDGIRECDGCQYADKGRKLRLKIQTTSGDKLREQTEQVLAEMMKNIGIELYIENLPSAELLGTFAAGAGRAHGKFDIVMYTSGPGPDPQGQMENYYASWNIPAADNKGLGYNFHRWINDEADQLIKLAGSSPDLQKRKDAYQRLCELIDQEVPAIYLYDRIKINAYRDTLQGWVANSWQGMGWNAEGWWLKGK